MTTSRPLSYLPSGSRHGDGNDEDDADPWATHPQEQHFSQDSDGLTARAVRSSYYGQDEDEDEEDALPQHQGHGQYESKDVNSYSATTGQSAVAHDENDGDAAGQVATNENNLTPKRPMHRATYSSTSTQDPWTTTQSADGPTSTLATAVRAASPPPPLDTLPASTSTFRGGFVSPPSHSASYLQQQQRQSEAGPSRPSSAIIPPSGEPVHAPTPWHGEQISVILRPELEGIIFKYNSYTVMRSSGSASESTVGSSAFSNKAPGQVLKSSRTQRAQRGNRRDNGAQANGATSVNDLTSSAGDHLAPFGTGKAVVRRYSDFVWLNDILLKRYPFRLVPILPPKRLSIPVAGKHLGGDEGFVERRRRGLQRYLRSLCAHPTLSRDPLVRTFLTDKRSIAEWRSANQPPSLEEEALSPHATPPPSQGGSGLLSGPSPFPASSSASSNKELDAQLDGIAQVTPAMVEKWTNLVSLFDRMSRRLEAQGLDHARLASLLDSLETTSGGLNRSLETQHRTNGLAQNGGGGSSSGSGSGNGGTRALVERVSEAHRDLSDLQSLRSASWTDSTLENLKRQRDLWLSLAQLLNRKQQLAGDDVTTLKQKVSATRTKLSALSSTPPSNRAANHLSEVEALESTLRTDSLRVDILMRRRERIRVCLGSELYWLSVNADKPRGEGAWTHWVAQETQLASATRFAMVECAEEMSNTTTTTTTTSAAALPLTQRVP